MVNHSIPRGGNASELRWFSKLVFKKDFDFAAACDKVWDALAHYYCFTICIVAENRFTISSEASSSSSQDIPCPAFNGKLSHSWLVDPSPSLSKAHSGDPQQ